MATLKELIRANPIGTELVVKKYRAIIIDGGNVNIGCRINNKACIVWYDGDEAYSYRWVIADGLLDVEATLITKTNKVRQRVIEE